MERKDPDGQEAKNLDQAQTWCLLFSHHILYKQWKNYKLAKSTYKREISDFGNGLQNLKERTCLLAHQGQASSGRDWTIIKILRWDQHSNMLFIPSLIDSMGHEGSGTCRRQSGHLASGPKSCSLLDNRLDSHHPSLASVFPIRKGMWSGNWTDLFPSFAFFFFFFLAKETFVS